MGCYPEGIPAAVPRLFPRRLIPHPADRLPGFGAFYLLNVSASTERVGSPHSRTSALCAFDFGFTTCLEPANPGKPKPILGQTVFHPESILLLESAPYD